jgi:hypothetical protein
MNEIENFALSQTLSTYPKNITFDEIIKRLTFGNRFESEQEMIVIKPIFQNFKYSQIVEHIEFCKKSIQELTKSEQTIPHSPLPTNKVSISFEIAGQKQQISVYISSIRQTPDSEIIRRAGNLFREAALRATYEIIE